MGREEKKDTSWVGSDRVQELFYLLGVRVVWAFRKVHDQKYTDENEIWMQGSNRSIFEN